MGEIKIRLLKSYKHKYKLKTWPVGQIVPCNLSLAQELIADKIAEYFDGKEYPRKKENKKKIQLKQL